MSADESDCFSNFELRLAAIAKRQSKTHSLFKRLTAIMDQIEENTRSRYKFKVQKPPKIREYLGDHNYAKPHSSSGTSSSSSTPQPSSSASPSHSSSGASSSSSTPQPSSSASPSSSSSDEQENTRFKKCLKVSAKQKIIDDDQESCVEDDDIDITSLSEDEQGEQYPQQVGNHIILGPNGTQVDVLSYNSIIWSSAASTTRQLLGFVFTSDILATHTLTGKPSPAFYGRERPKKIQLDPIKVADILHCVRSKFNCTEREIRAAITTKCSDTSKKYKRRRQKLLECSQVKN